MIEPFHNPPGVAEIQACIRKQHNLGHLRSLEAAKGEGPLLPALWILSAGRPETAIKAYSLRRMPAEDGWPAGFWQRDEVDALHLVVLRDLPRTRATLPLRLMGAGKTLAEAHEQLAGLPRGAWERELATRVWIVLRGGLPVGLDSSDLDEEAMQQIEHLNKLYEDWKREVEESGLEQGLRQALTDSYAARFGPMPTELEQALAGIRDPGVLRRLVGVFTTDTRDAVLVAVHAATGPT